MSALVDAIWTALHIAEEPHIDHCGMPCDKLAARDDCCSECAAATTLRGALRELGVHAFWHRKQGTFVVDEATCDRIRRARIDHVPETEAEWAALERIRAKRPEDTLTLTKFDTVFKACYLPEFMAAMAKKRMP